MISFRSALVGLVLGAMISPVVAADFSDPTWPCLQRKVGSLSLGLMWPYPVPESPIRPELKADANDLVETLILRRIPIEDAQIMIADFVATHPDLTEEDFGKIFESVFSRIDNERSRLIEGISRYSLTQIDVAARIDAARVEMDRLMALESPDYDKVDKLEEQIDWDERIFHDRAKSLTYVCETPVLMEKRAFAIAQSLSQFVPD